VVVCGSWLVHFEDSAPSHQQTLVLATFSAKPHQISNMLEKTTVLLATQSLLINILHVREVVWACSSTCKKTWSANSSAFGFKTLQ
jgi:hypothetical protein